MPVRYFTEADRFWSRVQPAGPEECWLWLGGKKAAGYGNMAVRKVEGGWTQTPAHRWAYANLVGPIPEHYEIDHLCGARDCVNPCHLEAVTVQENRRRRDKGHPFAFARPPAPMPSVGEPKPRTDTGPRPPATHCRNGHAYAKVGWVANGKGRTCAACRADATARRRRGGQHGTETHCPRGHPYSPENTYVRKRGGRECRTCVLAAQRAARKRHRN